MSSAPTSLPDTTEPVAAVRHLIESMCVGSDSYSCRRRIASWAWTKGTALPHAQKTQSYKPK
jgi:hypothetical protein